jgi:hypothetical protein
MDALAASTVATVDAALLIALTVDATSQKKYANLQENGTKPGRDEASDSHGPLHGIMEWLYSKGRLREIMAWLYIIGIFGVVVSLSMTLSSVEINKPMTGFAQHVVVDAAAAGFFPLVLGTVIRFLPDIKSKFVIVATLVIIVVGVILLQFWVHSYAPGTSLG